MVGFLRNRPEGFITKTGLLFCVVVSAIVDTPVCAEPNPSEFLVRGQTLYQRECASCHGADLKGEPGWQAADQGGKIKAPPHDETGHTWMHSESEIFRLVKFGPGDAAAPGYISPMPVYGGRLSDRDIEAVLAYIASRWPPGYRAYQIMLDPGFDPGRLPAGDWVLPEVCQPVPMIAAK